MNKDIRILKINKRVVTPVVDLPISVTAAGNRAPEPELPPLLDEAAIHDDAI